MSKIIWRSLGVVFLIFVILTFDWPKFYSIFHTVKIFPIILACGMNAVMLFLETVRWYALLKIQNIRYRLIDAFLASLSSSYAGNMTPGGIGSFIRVFYLEDDVHVSLGEALSSVVMDKMLALMTIVALGWWGLTLLGLRFQAIAVVGASIVLVALFFVALTWRPLHAVLEKIFMRPFLSSRFRARFDGEREKFYASFRQFWNIKMIKPVVVSLAVFGAIFLQAFLVADAVNIHLPFWDLSKTMALTKLVGRVVPVSFLGLGSKDVTFVVLLNKKFHIGMAYGVAFSIVFLFTSYFVSILMGMVAWLIKPIDWETRIRRRPHGDA